jgi:hypothetical protein
MNEREQLAYVTGYLKALTKRCERSSLTNHLAPELEQLAKDSELVLWQAGDAAPEVQAVGETDAKCGT